MSYSSMPGIRRPYDEMQQSVRTTEETAMTELPPLPATTWVDVPHFTYTSEAMRAYAAEAVRVERERLIRLVEARAQRHNGPHILTLELNQLATWMAGNDWNGITPPNPAA